MIRHALRQVRRGFVLLVTTASLAVSGLLPTTTLAADPPETWGTFGPVSFSDVAIATDGTVFVSDCGNARIYRIDGSSTIHVFAGAGPGGFFNGDSGDGGPALLAHFGCPYGLAFDQAGRLVVADHLNNKIRRIDQQGIVSTIAGVGPRSWGTGTAQVPSLMHAGDGGYAIQAVLFSPWRIAFDGLGNLYIGDRDHDAIRRVGTDGIITTVAGSGQRGYRGDGMLATDSKLNRPLDMAFRANGRMVIADENNSRVREVDGTGIISTIGGTGKLGCDGNGGPATAAPIQNVNSLDIARDGRIVLAGSIVMGESECHMVRMIRPDGTIQRLAGTGADACSGYDGGPALNADLSSPEGAVFAPNGDLYVVDDACGILLRIDGQGISHLVADASTAGS